MNTKIVLSKLHLADWPWTPEEGSAEYERGNRGVYYPDAPRIFHWMDAVNCETPEADKHPYTILNGYVFDSMPTINRCPECNRDFDRS